VSGVSIKNKTHKCMTSAKDIDKTHKCITSAKDIGSENIKNIKARRSIQSAKDLGDVIICVLHRA
jgi:hypothetical protein